MALPRERTALRQLSQPLTFLPERNLALIQRDHKNAVEVAAWPFGHQTGVAAARGNDVLHCLIEILVLPGDEDARVLVLIAEQLLLQPGDVVFVGPAGITRWNRFMTQLLPFSGLIRNAVDAGTNL